MLLIADAAAGPVAGIAAALALVLTPGFVTMHRESLEGPPLLAITLLIVAVMLHAPRFSVAYGTLSAVGGVFVATEGIGLPLAAAVWALLQPSRENGRALRTLLAVIPSAVVLWLAHLLGGAWPRGIVYGWRTDLTRVSREAGRILSGMLAPVPAHASGHLFVAAVVATLFVVGIMVGWRRAALGGDAHAAARMLYGIGVTLGIALGIGLLGRAVLVQHVADPNLAAMMPIASLCVLLVVVTFGTLWSLWPRWGRVVGSMIAAAWSVAAVVAWIGTPG